MYYGSTKRSKKRNDSSPRKVIRRRRRNAGIVNRNPRAFQFVSDGAKLLHSNNAGRNMSRSKTSAECGYGALHSSDSQSLNHMNNMGVREVRRRLDSHVPCAGLRNPSSPRVRYRSSGEMPALDSRSTKAGDPRQANDSGARRKPTSLNALPQAGTE